MSQYAAHEPAVHCTVGATIMSAVGATQQHPDMYPVDTALRSTLFEAVCSTQCLS